MINHVSKIHGITVTLETDLKIGLQFSDNRTISSPLILSDFSIAVGEYSYIGLSVNKDDNFVEFFAETAETVSTSISMSISAFHSSLICLQKTSMLTLFQSGRHEHQVKQLSSPPFVLNIVVTIGSSAAQTDFLSADLSYIGIWTLVRAQLLTSDYSCRLYPKNRVFVPLPAVKKAS
jgi:hypothetical protein